MTIKIAARHLRKHTGFIGETYTHQAITFKRCKFAVIDINYLGNGTCFLMENGQFTLPDDVYKAKIFNSIDEIRIWVSNNAGVFMDYSEVE